MQKKVKAKAKPKSRLVPNLKGLVKKAKAAKKKPTPKKKKVVRTKKPKYVVAKSRPRPTGVIFLRNGKDEIRKELVVQLKRFFKSGGSIKCYSDQPKPAPIPYKKPRYLNQDEFYGKRA